jgi:hypothetical protein
MVTPNWALGRDMSWKRYPPKRNRSRSQLHARGIQYPHLVITMHRRLRTVMGILASAVLVALAGGASYRAF